MKNVERTFISYSSKDFQLVTDLVKHLEAQGVNCWYAPRNIVPGKHYASSILEAIRACNAFVIVFSKNSNASEQCLKEVDRAVNARKPIIPFRVDETMPTEAMDYYLCNTHWLNAYEEVVTNYYQQLVHAVHDFISVEQEKTEYVTDVKPAKPDEMSRELQDVIQSLRNEALRDEEAALKYKEEKERLEEELEQKQNATVVQFPEDRTKKIIKKESKPLVIEAKKKRELRARKFEEEEQTFEKLKKKFVLPLALIAVAILFYMYRSTTSDNTIKIVEKKKPPKKEEVEKALIAEPPKVNYRKDFLDKNEMKNYGIEKLKGIKNLISARDGNIIRRTRSGLVESQWTMREVQNYFLLDHLIYEKARPTNKGLTSRVYLGFDFPIAKNPENPDEKPKPDPMRRKTLWEAGSLLIKEKLYDEDLDLMYLKIHPDGNLTNFPKAGELVVTIKIVESEERFVKVIHSGGMKMQDSLSDLRQFTENINLDLKIAEAGSSWPSKEIVIEYHHPKLNLEGYKSISVQLVDIARLFVNSKKLLSSI